MSHGVRCLAYEAAFASGMAMTDGRHELQVALQLSAYACILLTLHDQRPFVHMQPLLCTFYTALHVDLALPTRSLPEQCTVWNDVS